MHNVIELHNMYLQRQRFCKNSNAKLLEHETYSTKGHLTGPPVASGGAPKVSPGPRTQARHESHARTEAVQHTQRPPGKEDRPLPQRLATVAVNVPNIVELI